MPITPDPRSPDPRSPDPRWPNPPARAARRSRRRAAVTLVAVAAAVLALLAVLATVVLAPPPVPAPEVPPAPAPAPVDAGDVDGGDWDLAAQTELATRPMPQLPDAAALPHPLSTDPPAPALRLPAPAPGDGATGDGGVPRGFPPTPEGALAQLVALTDAGMRNADPQAYAAAYDAVAAPGAPPVTTTPLHRGLVAIRARAGLPATGALPDLSFDWTPASGLIKGSTDRGRYVVACVLGQLDTGAGGRILSTGAGDCQALRYQQGRWWISPGPAAAPAPLAWPGTAEAARVGYRAAHHAR